MSLSEDDLEDDNDSPTVDDEEEDGTTEDPPAEVTDEGPASSLSSIGNAISGVFSALTSGIKALGGTKLPLPNPLFDYASYTYTIGLGCLSDDQVNKPDSTYMKNMSSIKLICKSANIDPSNRVTTPFGQFDFYIDNLEMKSLIGYEQGSQNTNVTNFTFKIIEPYSMGMFIISCQQLAQKLGHDNWREAPFVLTIDFKGAKETGVMATIPGCSRIIPFTFNDMNMTVDQNGSVYNCTAQPWNQWALGDEANLFKTDASGIGKTVQEILQSGDNSLQAQLNKRLQEQAKAIKAATKAEHVPDQYLILFPIDTSSSASPAQGSEDVEDDDGPTEDDSGEEDSSGSQSTTSGTASEIYQLLGVSVSPANAQVVQNSSNCNNIGRASMAFDEKRRADPRSGYDSKIYDDKTATFDLNKLKTDPKETEVRFAQDTAITAAINQVILQSGFVNEALDKKKISPEGYRGWYRIAPKLYNIGSTPNVTTGTKPKLIVYEVVPANAHSSRLAPPNAGFPGLKNLKLQAVKEYNYIYTGKNVDIMKFEIKIENGFTAIMGSDALKRTQDKVTEKQTGGAEDEQDVDEEPMPAGNPPSKELGKTPTILKWIGVKTGADGGGGGGQEGQGQRAAKLFNDAFNSLQDMYNLDLEIIGDPYWIVQSGLGNYTSKKTQYANLNADGTANYENGEVDIMVNFRTPVDINQATGLYDFGKSSKSAPVLQYSGLYCVQEIWSRFAGGKFTQKLGGFRRPNQDNPFDDPNQLFSSKGNEVVQKNDNSNE
jgi:hypothetical protein